MAALVDELDLRVERLRVLYDQYFMGIEKIPPEVLKKDVERWPFHRDSWSRMCSVHQALGDYRRADEARSVLKRIDRDALYEGDSTHVIAGTVLQPQAAE